MSAPDELRAWLLDLDDVDAVGRGLLDLTVNVDHASELGQTLIWLAHHAGEESDRRRRVDEWIDQMLG